MNSMWKDNINMPRFDKLKKDIKTDVLIIGGGLCGLLCAYFLDRAGVNYILVEGSRIASGISGNTTAKITFQHGLIYSKLIGEYGKEKAKMYLEANRAALNEYEKMCAEFKCDFEKKDAYTYSMKDRKKIEDEVKAVMDLGFGAEFITDLEIPFRTEGAVCFKNQAQFNPLKFIAQVAKKLKIYENTFVREIENGLAFTDKAKIKADKIIVATHFPFINSHGSYFLKLYQHRSYVSAFENAIQVDGMYVDEDKKGMSFRNYGEFLFIGGEGHRTGKQSESWRSIEKFAKKNYPSANLKYSWAAQDCMSLDGVPYIGNYSAKTPRIYVASGFNKWGITSSMVAAMMLCDMVQDKKNEFELVFSPQRSIIKPQLFVNAFESTVNLLTPTPKRCSHMGCALKWNKWEHSWDCTCHGSRFTKEGKLIDNPATKNIKI